MNKFITISTAVCNIENYVRIAINSFANEDVIDTLEIVIVDDGDEDDTLKIAHEFVGKYSRLFFLE